jgi:ribonuclease HI
MPEGISDRIPTPTGIPQGSPISPILYLIYNADLIENSASVNGVTSNGWVDDVAFMAKGDSERETVSKLRKACGKADTWAKRHASVFDTKKYALIHFVNPREAEPRHTPLRLSDGTTIQPTTSAERYLGFWLDPELRFDHHRDHVVAKADRSLQALRGLAGSVWGASLSSMRRIYQAVIIPQMLFGISAWFQPLLENKRTQETICRPFASIQKRAACLISGAFKTTAAEALNVELHLLPIAIHMDRLVKDTALRLRTGPIFAVPPTMLRCRPADDRDWSGWTPMEAQAWRKGGCLTALPEAVAGRWESRKAFVREPWRAPPEVIIEDRETAVTTHSKLTTETKGPLVIYTDGSGFEGRVGAAAVGPDCHRHSQMGTEATTTVYAAELRAIGLALEIALETPTQNGVVIFSDSQAALRALCRPRMPSGQVYLERCLDHLALLSDRGRVQLRWIPAHQGIPGNELADQNAKQAAHEELDPQNPSNCYIRLSAAVRRRHREEAKEAWRLAWVKEKTGRPTKRLIEVPTKKVLQYWTGLRKATTSIMIQLRTGRVGLAAYLAKINRADTPRCACDLGNQTIDHVLLECPQYQEERSQMRRALFEKGVSMIGSMEMLQQKAAATIVADFMVKTGALGQFLAVDPVAMGMEEEEVEESELARAV